MRLPGRLLLERSIDLQRVRGRHVSAPFLVLAWEEPWRDMAWAPKNGTAIYAYGIHTGSPLGAARGVKAGDDWWAILVWDVWRPSGGWVFSKDGTPAWSQPACFQPIVKPRRLFPTSGESHA